jgi:orotidine-5'-phosphate decarboxylase
MSRNFRDLLEARWAEGKALCVGLDPDFEKIPESAKRPGIRETFVAFGRAIVDSTCDLVCAFKPNSAFYEAHGDEGWKALRETIQYIREKAPDVAVILDSKRADIGNTNDHYAISAFDHLHVDAMTINPYPGRAALEPFLARSDKGILVWCRTSNEGASEFQDLKVQDLPLYAIVARHVATRWNERGNCGLVVGATYPDEMAEVRLIAGDMPILIPGIGAQGGDVGKTVAAGRRAKGGGMVISASRSVTYASAGEDFAQAARAKAQELDAAVRAAA